MAAWEPGRSTVKYLLANGRLEAISPSGLERVANELLTRATRRLGTASAGLHGGDIEGAFVAAYDAYRMSAESLLIRQGLRTTGGDGSHVTVEDSISAQFGSVIDCFSKPIFERFRRTRHIAQYFDPDAPEIVGEDAQWAIETARSAVEGTQAVIELSRIEKFTPED